MQLELYGFLETKRSIKISSPGKQVKNQILFKVAEFWSSLPQTNSINQPSDLDSQNNISTWIKPSSERSKLNVDGLAKGNLLAVGVIRSERGEWIIGYSKFMGLGNSKLAKA